MSTYANTPNSHLISRGPNTLSVSKEMQAIVAGLAVWVVLLGLIAMKDTSQNADLHSNTNAEDIRIELPEADQMKRQHY